MKTIGIWYKKSSSHDDSSSPAGQDDSSSPAGQDDSPSPVELDVHVNYWKLFKHENRKEADYFLDLGLMVYDIKRVSEIHIHFPTIIQIGNFVDLGGIFKQHQRLINSVFNENYGIHNPEEGKRISVTNKKDRTTVFNIYALDFSAIPSDAKICNNWDGSHLCINVNNLTPTEGCGKYYFRFRINGKAPEEFRRDHIPRDRFFKSAFTSTEIIDFRINEKRNYHPGLVEEINANNEFAINKIHFLLMRKADEDFDSSHIQASCRELEQELWTNYIGNGYDLKDILAYHWSEKGSDEKHVDSFNSLIRMKYNKSDWKTISIYILIIGLLSIFFNIASSFLWSCIHREPSTPKQVNAVTMPASPTQKADEKVTTSTQMNSKVVIIESKDNLPNRETNNE